MTETIWGFDTVQGVMHSDEERAAGSGSQEGSPGEKGEKKNHESDAKPL
jgi:hypothetical protein